VPSASPTPAAGPTSGATPTKTSTSTPTSNIGGPAAGIKRKYLIGAAAVAAAYIAC
jgi:hypothetical protein